MSSCTADSVAQQTRFEQDHANESDHRTSDLCTQRVARSVELIKTARENAAREHGYCSQETRLGLSVAFAEACSGKQPYDWQLDVSEALLLGLDTVVTAGTGAGKSIPFVMPLLLEKKSSKKMVIIISPLNELERDQARRFRDMGLSAAAVNGEDYTVELHREISAKSVQVLVTSPEMCLEHPLFSALVRAPEFMYDVLYVVVDEAHCISQWGDKFRKKYAELSKLRSFLGVRKAFGLFTATLPDFMAADVFLTLEFRELTTYFCNLGNDRPNITPIVHRLKAAQSSLAVIDFLVRDARPGTTLPRTILFFNTRDLAFRAYRYLQDCVSADLRPQINFLHAGRGRRARRRAIRGFRTGAINILCATEAAGMGMDIADIRMIIQFLVPTSLSVWVQRAGRAGRGGDHSYAVLLVEPAVFEVKAAPKPHTTPTSAPDDIKHLRTTKRPQSKLNSSVLSENSAGQSGTNEDLPTPSTASHHTGTVDGAVEFKKSVEDGMRLWASATSCRRAVADNYFNNPLSRGSSTRPFPCCDNCVRTKNAKGHPLSCAEQAVLDIIYRLANGSDVGQSAMDDDEEGEIDVVASAEAQLVGGIKLEIEEEEGRDTTVPQAMVFATRRGEHLADCRARLYRWRMEVWMSKYANCVFTHQILLPDIILTWLASQGRIRTVADLKRHIPQWAFADIHGPDVLHVLSVIDMRYQLELEAKKQIKREAQEARSLAKGKRTNTPNVENHGAGEPSARRRVKQRTGQEATDNSAGAMTTAVRAPLDGPQKPVRLVWKAHVFPTAAESERHQAQSDIPGQVLAASEAPSKSLYPGPVRFA